MPFNLVFQDGLTLDLNVAYLTRELGAPVGWRFLVDLEPDNTSGRELEAGLRKSLLGGPATVKAVRQPGNTLICPSGRVVSVERPAVTGASVDGWEAYGWRLDVLAQATAPTSDRISPFLPRRRVLKAKNMLELFDNFKHIAEPISRVRAALQTIEFPDKDRSSIIQDGISDWLFFGIILDQCRLLSPRAIWLPLTLVGGANQEIGTAGKWLVVPGLKGPYAEWREVENRKISFTQEDGEERFLYGEVQSLSRVPLFPSGRYPAFGIGRPSRTFQAARWHTWSNLDLPRFTDQGEMVYRIEDCITRTPQDNIGWQTFAFACPSETQVTGPIPSSRPTPWMGLGKVHERDKVGPWIKVQLEGFEEGSDIADVRISTPFSGSDGKKGLHLIPEKETDIEVRWTGRFDSSVIFGCNTRRDSSDFESPSLFLEETHTAHYENVRIKRVGDVTIDSDLSMAVGQSTNLKSRQPIKLTGDGADLKLSGGVVYTGRGF